MTHFDTALNKQGTFTVRARVAGDDVTDVGHFRRRDIAVPVDAEVVFAIDIMPAAKSLITATVRSIITGTGMFTGPGEPGPAFTRARISSSVAKVRGLATCGSFSAFTSFSS